MTVHTNSDGTKTIFCNTEEMDTVMAKVLLDDTITGGSTILNMETQEVKFYDETNSCFY